MAAGYVSPPSLVVGAAVGHKLNLIPAPTSSPYCPASLPGTRDAAAERLKRGVTASPCSARTSAWPPDPTMPEAPRSVGFHSAQSNLRLWSVKWTADDERRRQRPHFPMPFTGRGEEARRGMLSSWTPARIKCRQPIPITGVQTCAGGTCREWAGTSQPGP
jgi:hypothetical protein